MVRLIDYGDEIEVIRDCIWAPVNLLKQFMMEPFGINCRLNQGLHLTVEEWENTFADKQLQVKIVSSDGPFHVVTLLDVIANEKIISALKPKISAQPKQQNLKVLSKN